MTGAQTASLFRRLYSRIEFNPENGCWEWQGCRNGDGYGEINSGGRGRLLKTHRAAWALANGEIPDGMCVLHSCDNPACCYVGHLWLGTQLENIRDRDSKGRTGHTMGRHGEKHNWTKLTEAQIFAIRKDPRSYRIIAAEYGCRRGHVGRIKRKERWGWLTDVA